MTNHRRDDGIGVGGGRGGCRAPFGRFSHNYGERVS